MVSTAADSIVTYQTRNEVERLLEAKLGDEESTGFYEGQFKSLEALGREKVVQVLIQMLSDRKYPFGGMDRRENPHRFRAAMKEMAVMALGEYPASAESRSSAPVARRV